MTRIPPKPPAGPVPRLIVQPKPARAPVVPAPAGGNVRRPGAVQTKAGAGGGTIVRGPVISISARGQHVVASPSGSAGRFPVVPGGSAILQPVMRYGAVVTLAGGQGSVHYHYSFNDAAILNSLHVTFADTQNFANRTWASRSSYTPTGRAAAQDGGGWLGNWGALVTQLGVIPAWGQALVNAHVAAAQAAGLAAFHGNAAITALLNAAYPPPVPVAADFPAL
jgi:hypothetical protein